MRGTGVASSPNRPNCYWSYPMRSTPMLFVRDVPASADWYKDLMGATTDHHREDFDRVVDGDEVLLMLHRWNDGEHGMPVPADGAEAGLGFIVWINVPDVDRVYARAKAKGAEIVSDLHSNPLAGWREFTLRDPDGYRIAFAQW